MPICVAALPAIVSTNKLGATLAYAPRKTSAERPHYREIIAGVIRSLAYHPAHGSCRGKMFRKYPSSPCGNCLTDMSLSQCQMRLSHRTVVARQRYAYIWMALFHDRVWQCTKTGSSLDRDAAHGDVARPKITRTSTDGGPRSNTTALHCLPGGATAFQVLNRSMSSANANTAPSFIGKLP